MKQNMPKSVNAPVANPVAPTICKTLMTGAVMAATLCWSSTSLACSPEPYVSAVCIMAVPWTNLSGYSPANGATLNITTNQVLFSLIGVTYGGNPSSNFMLPDLRGRVVVGAGAGPGLPVFNVGDKAGAATVSLAANQVPLAPHSHAIAGVAVSVGPGNLQASTTMSGLQATVSMANVTASADGTKLGLKAYSGPGTLGTASGNALATSASPPNKIYAPGAPDVTMTAGSIAGTAPVSFQGQPTVSISGTPTTTLSGAPTVALSGNTSVSAANPTIPVNIMPPYLSMNYFIAVQGLYPSRD